MLISGTDVSVPYRDLVQEMSEGALVLVPGDRIVYSNQQFASMLGIPVDRVTGASIHDFIFPDDAPAFAALLAQGRQAGAKGELRLRGPGRKPMPAFLSVKGLPPNGMEGVCVLVKDLTERKESQGMRAAQRLARSILEEVSASILLVDLDGSIIRANRAAEQLTNQSLLQRDFDAVFHVRGPMDWSYARILSAVQEGPIDGLELTAAQSGGRTAALLLSAVPLFDDDSQLLGCILTLTDITARRQAEEALLRSRERLEMVHHAAGAGTWDRDIASGSLEWSPELFRLFGLDRHKVTPSMELFFSVMHDDDREATRSRIAQAIRDRTGVSVEYRVVLPDGGVRWISALGHATYDAGGRPIGTAGICIDITAHKHLDEELRRRAEEMEKVMEVAPVAIWVAHDPLCRTVTGNPAANRLFEVGEGTNIAAGPVPGDPNPQFRMFRDGRELKVEEFPMQVAAARGEDVRDVDMDVLLSSGKRITLWGHASPLRDARGRVRGCVGAFLDITQTRQRAEAALRESEERFQTMADTAPMMIWVNGPDGACQFINKAWITFTGVSPEHARGSAWTDCIHPDDLEKYLHTRSSALQVRRSYQAEYRLRRADGEYRWVLSHTTPRFGVDGAFAGTVGSCLDITDVKRAQEQDLARQKLESVGTLAGGIAHDFNNLLGSVLASTELALAEVEDGLSPAESLHRIREVAVRGAEIVRQLMIYAGQESPVCELVDVSRVVDEMVELLRISTRKQVVLKTALEIGLPLVPANPAQIRQVVMNLVINASEAIGKSGGVIEVATSKVAIGPEGLSIGSDRLAEGDFVRLSVSDTGRGMTPAAQARVFDPFFTTKSAGHGLGLAVVQGIVRVLGGAIRLDSSPRGTTFEIFLPCAGKTVQEDAGLPGAGDAAAEPIPDSSAVLVIEDEDTLRTTVSKLLRKAGFSVMHARDGSAGLDLLRRHPQEIGVMLLDVTLPGVSSQEVLRQARRLRSDLKVILTSAYSEESVAAWFQEEKFDGFIRKPYRLADLTAMLR